MLKIGVPGDLAEIREKVYAGERLSFEDGLKLFESNDVVEMGRLANHVREKLHGDKAYFSHKYRLYPTNVCVYRCRFCAFRVSKGDERGYEWPAEKTLHELEKVDLTGVAEFHIVGGIHPDWGFDVYLDIVRELHRVYPHVHIKAWTAVEPHHTSTEATEAHTRPTVPLTVGDRNVDLNHRHAPNQSDEAPVQMDVVEHAVDDLAQ